MGGNTRFSLINIIRSGMTNHAFFEVQHESSENTTDLSVCVSDLGPSSQSPAVPAKPHTLMA